MTPGSDAELVAGVLAGDRAAFAGVYERYADRLHDFAYSMLRSREEAADCVADSFVVMAEKLGQLRDPASLRPWLYSVVRNECLRTLRGRARLAHDDEWLEAMPDLTDGPEQQVEKDAVQEELRDLVWAAAAGLNERDRALLDLHLRQGLDGAELAQAMEVSTANAYVMLSRVRDQVERSLGALLIARRGSDDCATLAGLLESWDGRFSPLIRKRVARHIDGCDVCDVQRKLMLSPMALLSAVPVFAAPAALRDRVLGDQRLVAHYVDQGGTKHGGTLPPPGPGAEPVAGEDDDHPPGGLLAGGRRRLAAVGLLVLLLGLVAVPVLVLWPAADGDLKVADTTPTTSAATTPGTQAVVPEPSEAPSLAAPLTTAPTADPSAPAAPTAPTASTTSTDAPLASPASLEVSTRTLDLGTRGTSGSVRLRNSGGQSLQFTASPRTGWLSVSPDGASLGAGASTTLAISADRSGLAEGSHSGQVAVRWSGGTVLVTVRLTVDRAPVIGPIAVVVGDTCVGAGRPVTASATVTDGSALSSVRVSWSGTASGRTTATRAGERWTGSISSYPFGDGMIRFTATDGAGHRTVRSTAFSVDPCPG